MSFAFDPHQGLIIGNCEIEGPSASAFVRLALDTGATYTVVNAAVLVALGYNPALAVSQTQLATASGIAYAPQIIVSRMVALGQTRHAFPVFCHTLPPATGVDGLLGLDFMRGLSLTLDFRTGQGDLF